MCDSFVILPHAIITLQFTSAKNKKDGNSDMRKVMTIITSVILATMMFITGGFASSKVYAADESSKYIKGATFLSAVHGQTEDGTEIVLALYEKKNGEDIAYINDGMGHIFSDFTIKYGTMKGIGPVQYITVGDNLVITYFESDGIPGLIAEDGTIYACEYLDAYTVSQLMSTD